MIRPELLPDCWPKARLSDVVEFLDSRRKPVKASDRIEGPYPYYGANGQQGTINDYIFNEPLVLVAEDGGHFGVADRPIAYLVSGKYWVNNHAHVLKPKEGLDINYLFRHLQFYDVTKYITGSTRKKLTKSDASRIELTIPPIEEQRRIAAILDKADAIRQKRKSALTLADTFLRATFLDMFGSPVTNPKGWEIGTIRDLVTEAKYGTSAKADPQEGEYPVLRMGNITYSGDMKLSDLKYIDLSEKDKKKYLVQKDDILFNRTNSKELVGKTTVFDLEDAYAYAGYLVRLRTNDKADPYYISGYLNSSHGKATLMGMCKNIVGMANINAQEVQDIKIALPPIELQKKYREAVNKVKLSKVQMNEAVTQAETLFASLSQRAFKGEL